MEFVLEFLTNIIYVWSFICIGNYFFDFKRRNGKYAMPMLMIVTFFTTVLWFYAHVLVRMIAHGLCIVITLKAFYREKYRILITFYVGIAAILSMLELMIEVVISEINIYFKGLMSEYEINLLSQAIVGALIWLTGYYFSRKHLGGLKKLGVRYLLVFAIMLFIDATIVTLLGHYVIDMLEAERKWGLVILYFGVVIGILIQIVLLINALITRSVYKENEALAKKYLENQSEHYLYLEKREEKTKKFRHDIKNHLLILDDLMQKKDYASAEDYLNTLNDKVNMFGNHISVNNGIADAILNKFYDEAQEDGVELKVSGHFPLECNLSAFDICTVLSNLLSNAILAEKQAGGERVSLDIRYTSEVILIIVENDYTHELRVENGIFKTTQNDAGGHGFGLVNVQECVEKNSGSISISTDNQRFKVMLELKNEGRIHENCNCR